MEVGYARQGLMLTAAAAKYDDQSQNDDPSAVIVKKMAKTVVHSSPPKVKSGFPADFSVRSAEAGCVPYTNILCRFFSLVLSFFRFIFRKEPLRSHYEAYGR